MDFSFSPEQNMMRDSVRRLLARHVQKGALLEGTAGNPAYTRRLWGQLGELGLMAVMVPEGHDGLGGGVIDMVAIHEELGRGLAPVPFTSTAVTAVSMLRRLGTTEQQASWLPSLAAGERLFSLAWLEEDADWLAPETRLTVEPGNPARLTGSKRVVEFPEAASQFLVVSLKPEGASAHRLQLFLVDAGASGLSIATHQPLDPTAPVGTLTLKEVAVSAASQLTAPLSSEELRELMAPAIIATCGEMIGAAEAALQETIAYLKERTQFGRPVGSFQAVKHKVADNFVLLENARSATYYAAWALDTTRADRDLAVDTAKAYTVEMAYRVTADAIQLHGGIGFTWEHPLHLYFKRVRRLLCFFGDGQQARDRIGMAITTGPAAW